jgi:HEAT repeat protein
MAARFAGRSRDTQAALVLQQCLRDDSGAVQIAALEVIGRRPEPSCVEAVRALLQSPDADVVSAALATAVAMLGRGAPSPAHQEWAAMMTRCLDHPSWAVRVAALQALASVSPAEARQQAGLLAGRDAHARVREAASRLSGEGS